MLHTYLIAYGADNEFWLCQAENKEHAIEQFESAEMEGEINHIFRCIEE